MLVERIIKQTVYLQSFYVHTVSQEPHCLIAEIRWPSPVHLQFEFTPDPIGLEGDSISMPMWTMIR